MAIQLQLHLRLPACAAGILMIRHGYVRVAVLKVRLLAATGCTYRGGPSRSPPRSGGRSRESVTAQAECDARVDGSSIARACFLSSREIFKFCSSAIEDLENLPLNFD